MIHTKEKLRPNSFYHGLAWKNWSKLYHGFSSCIAYQDYFLWYKQLPQRDVGVKFHHRNIYFVSERRNLSLVKLLKHTDTHNAIECQVNTLHHAQKEGRKQGMVEESNDKLHDCSSHKPEWVLHHLTLPEQIIVLVNLSLWNRQFGLLGLYCVIYFSLCSMNRNTSQLCCICTCEIYSQV